MAIRQYSISTFQQVLLLSHGILTIIAVAIGMVYYTGSILPTIWVLLPYSIYFLVNILPAIILHVQYFNKNRRIVLTIDTDKKMFSISNADLGNSYNFSDINKVKFFGSYGKGTGFYSFGEYRYCELIMNDNSVFIITCLMVNNIENRLREEFGIELVKNIGFMLL